MQAEILQGGTVEGHERTDGGAALAPTYDAQDETRAKPDR